MTNGKSRTSVIAEIAAFFLAGMLVTGLLAYFTLRSISIGSVKEQRERLATQVASEVTMSVKEFPAYRWLIQYWFEHADELDIEYDVEYGSDTRTEEKARTFSDMHPDIPMKYASEEELEALPEEDQRLYAEITYSWLITRVNQIKRSYGVDYLFCVSTDDTFQTQFFLFSAADEGAVRGTNYEEVYLLGTTVSVADNPSQQAAMRLAEVNKSHLAYAGAYMDHYAFLDRVDDRCILVGQTFDLSQIMSTVQLYTWRLASDTVILQLVLSLLCLTLISLFVLRPLKRIQGSIRRYRDTKDSDEIIQSLSKVRARNEIGQLSLDVSDMAKELGDYLGKIESITAERERIGTELALASGIQSHMLPSVFPPFPERKEFELYAIMDPAKEVGGDFYDFFMIDSDHLALVVADVSGKGVPAALFSMIAKTLLKTQAQTRLDPERVLREVNASLCEGNEESMFVTVWLGVLEISTGELTYADAGHEKLLLYQDREWRFLPKTGGVALAMFDPEDLEYMDEKYQFRNQKVRLGPGDAIFQYSDGVTEATNEENELFGEKRFLNVLNEAKSVKPETLLPYVRERIDEFVKDAPQFDDITMLTLQMKEKDDIERY